MTQNISILKIPNVDAVVVTTININPVNGTSQIAPSQNFTRDMINANIDRFNQMLDVLGPEPTPAPSPEPAPSPAPSPSPDPA